MAKYQIVFEDPDAPDDPTSVLLPADEWLAKAMAGEFPEIGTMLKLKLTEEKFMRDNPAATGFEHDEKMWQLQFEAPRTGPMTEEQAMEYLLMKDVPINVWGRKHNRLMYKIVEHYTVPKERTFRNAWRLNT